MARNGEGVLKLRVRAAWASAADVVAPLFAGAGKVVGIGFGARRSCLEIGSVETA